jgi:hypothetical protein
VDGGGRLTALEGPFDNVGRTTAFTALTPVRRLWAVYLRVDFALLKALKWLMRQKDPARPVKRLSFISFGRWAVVDRIPASLEKGRARPLPHPYIVFQSNFNGQSHEYFEAFALGLKWRMRGLWRGAYGVPDPSDLGGFSDYVHHHWQPVAHYYSAYPQASTKMVLSALALRREFESFAAWAERAAPKEFAEEFEAFVERAIKPPLKAKTKWNSPGAGFAVLIPVRPNEEGKVLQHIHGVPRGAGSPFSRVEGTHYARIQLVELHGPKVKSQPKYLFFSAEHDGPTEDYVRRLCDRLHYEAHEIWEHCEGYPGTDPGALERYLLDHRVKPGYSVVAYPGVSVEEVRSSLSLQDRMSEFVVRTRGFNDAALHEAWCRRFRGGGR